MKGILFNVLEDVVEQSMSAQVWDEALLDAEVEGAYTSLGNYDTCQLGAIVASLASRNGLSVEELLVTAGRSGYTSLAERHADVVAPYGDFGALLENLDTVIHPEVLKLYPSSRPPRFDVRSEGPGAWEVVYSSDRHLCHLAEGLMAGAAESFGETLEISQVDCVLRGDDRCRFALLRTGTDPDGAGTGP